MSFPGVRDDPVAKLSMKDYPRRVEENAAFHLERNAHFYVAIIGESQLASSSFVYMYGFGYEKMRSDGGSEQRREEVACRREIEE